MFKHKFTESVPHSVEVHWFVLAFLAGCVNAGGWMSCHRFVSHVTGFGTLAGIEFYNGASGSAFAILSIPAFFLLGAMVSGFLIESQTESRGRYLSYSYVMGLVSICLGVVALGGRFSWFGPFGEPADIWHDYMLQALLCGACGLLNAAVTSSSGGTVRVTHVTGLTTDLGLGIVRAAFRYKNGEPSLPLEVRINILRICSIISFIMGSATAAAIFYNFEYIGFLLPTTVAIYVTVIAYRQVEKEDLRSAQAATATSSQSSNQADHKEYKENVK